MLVIFYLQMKTLVVLDAVSNYGSTLEEYLLFINISSIYKYIKLIFFLFFYINISKIISIHCGVLIHRVKAGQGACITGVEWSNRNTCKTTSS
jgi:hypothetical protein